MKKLLTCAAALGCLSGVAYGADPATNHTVGTASASFSILQNLLSHADALSASVTNAAENLNNVDGSINLTTSRSSSDLASAIDALNGAGNDPFGSYSQIGSSVYAQDIPAALLNVLNPTSTSVGDLSTTAIGSMQSGSMTSAVNAGGIVSRISDAASSSTTTTTALAEAYGGIAKGLAFQNVSVNEGDINGSVQVSLADTNASIGKVGTTAIGSMGSGSLTATLSGNMDNVDNSIVNVINALIGAPG